MRPIREIAEEVMKGRGVLMPHDVVVDAIAFGEEVGMRVLAESILDRERPVVWGGERAVMS